MVVGDVAITGLTKSMDALSSNIKAALDFADKAQKASLALGQTYEDTRVQLGGTMEGLRGDINQRFGAAIAGMEAGLQGNTAGLAKLINQQQLTGTSFAKTAGAVAQLEGSLQLSRDQTNNLTNSLISTGNEYQISTDKLVDAIDALKATFPAQALAGMGDKVVGAVASLQAELGPQFGSQLQSVMGMIMDTSMQGYENLVKLGLGDVRERLSAARDEVEAAQILKEAFATGSDTFKRFAGSPDSFFAQMGIAAEHLGDQAILFTTVADNLGKRVKKENDEAADFGKTLANLKVEVMVPFQEAFSLAYPFLLEAMDTFSAIANTVGERFKAFAESLGGDKGAADAMKTFKLAVLDFAVMALGKLEGTFNFVKVLITETVPMIFTKFSDGVKSFFQMGGPFDKLKVALLTLAEGAAGAGRLLGNDAAADLESELMLKRITLQGRIHGIEKAAAESEEAAERIRRIYRLKDTGMDLTQAIAAVDASPQGEKGIGDMLRDAADLSFGENAKRSPMYAELKAMRTAIEEDKNLRGEANSELRKLNKTNEEMNNKMPEPTSRSVHLDETADILGRSIEAILGIGADTVSAEMLEEIKIGNQIAAATASNRPSAIIATNS